MSATPSERVAAEAAMVAAAWSPPGAPPSWRLTAPGSKRAAWLEWLPPR